MISGAALALPQGYALNEYRIESTLGVGGFGLTYLATDSNLNLKVAIKEYLPDEFAIRCENQSVRPKSHANAGTFKSFLSRFLEESRTLASFRHPNIVRVMRFFEANQTAYMVMEFVAGQSLNDWIKVRRPLAEQTVISIAGPLLDGLEVIHRANYLHRDIKPNNVFIREDITPVLLDFGSARVVSPNTEMTSIVSPGYAPFEQYHSQGHQGPWSDLYALGGVLYWMVTGNQPLESAARVRKDVMTPAAEAGDRSRYSLELLKAIDWALSPLEEARPQSAEEFRDVLGRLAPLPAPKTPTVLAIPQPDPNVVSGKPGVTAPTAFDRGTLEKIDAELAKHIGPIASMVVRSGAKKALTLAQLVELIAAEISDGNARTAFVRKFTASDKSAPTGPPISTATRNANSAPLRFDPETLAKVEADLAKYIGAVARVLVRRAARKARDESELYLFLADEIEDSEGKKAFVRKSLSASSKA